MMDRMVRTIPVLLITAALLHAEKVPAARLLEMARANDPALEQTLRDTLTEDALKKGTAVIGEGPDFVWAVISDKQPVLRIDFGDPLTPRRAGGLWMYAGKLKTGTAHKAEWFVDGKSIGGANNIAAYPPESYPQTGVPEGKLTGPIVMESKIYPGMQANVWYYVPAQWDGTTPLAVQIWGDGQMYTKRMTNYRVLETLDNLHGSRRIPLTANVFIQPGTVNGTSIRSKEYDTVDDTYSRYILQEILPEVGKAVRLRADGYSRLFIGESSGGICAFNAAWFAPEDFSRVLSWIGSFAALQVSDKEPVGGAAYPIKVRREAKRNIRVWLQDGAEDQENPRAGSWPLANIHLANSLKLKGYDYHFSFGLGTHNQMQGSAELAESLVWLWRDYDPAKTSQEFVQDPAEKEKPMWQVVKLNRN
jgi:enterochelin esterase-like enzyme